MNEAQRKRPLAEFILSGAEGLGVTYRKFLLELTSQGGNVVPVPLRVDITSCNLSVGSIVLELRQQIPPSATPVPRILSVD